MNQRKLGIQPSDWVFIKLTHYNLTFYCWWGIRAEFMGVQLRQSDGILSLVYTLLLLSWNLYWFLNNGPCIFTFHRPCQFMYPVLEVMFERKEPVKSAFALRDWHQQRSLLKEMSESLWQRGVAVVSVTSVPLKQLSWRQHNWQFRSYNSLLMGLFWALYDF